MLTSRYRYLMSKTNAVSNNNTRLTCNQHTQFTHFTYVRLSKVLTDHFSNSLFEKTINDIPMKFSGCHFKTTFYRLPLSNREN